MLIEMLNILEGYELRRGDPARVHLMIEAMKLAYADRAQLSRRSRFVKVPVAGLISKDYAAKLRERIDPDSARRRRDEIRAGDPPAVRRRQHHALFGGRPLRQRGREHLDPQPELRRRPGRRGTGVLLNNELDDFAAKPGAPNAFGLVGASANAPGPSKRPLSSMTPTIVLKDGKPLLVTGSPGGSRIITAVLQVIINVIDYGMTHRRRGGGAALHHQWLPDEVWAEARLSPPMLKELEARGHKIVPRTGHVSEFDPGRPKGLIGAADTRTRGALAAGY